MQLDEEIKFDLNIRPARLPFREVKYNVEALVAGWGLNELYQLPENLRKLSVVSMYANSCKEVYDFDVTERNDVMCARNNRKIGFGTCNVSSNFFV